MKRAAWFLVLWAIGLGGCASNELVYVPIVHPAQPLASRSVDQVDTFVATPPARPHIDLGVLQVISHDYGPRNPISLQQTMLQLRTAAATLGCDALLITSIDSRSTRYTSGSVQATCEVYTDRPAQ